MAQRRVPLPGLVTGQTSRHEVAGQTLHHVVEGNRQGRATVGIQGAEKSMTPKMTLFLGRSCRVELRGL